MYYYDLLLILYIELFRIFFFGKYNILDNKILNCDKLLICFFWRWDYIVYFRNLKGIVSCKVKNEKEIEDFVVKMYFNYLIESF